MSNDGGGTDDAQGRLIGGRYRLVERIGSGGTGTVWRALDELTQREVAVRQPRLPGDPQGGRHRRAAHRLHREARAAARVDHPSAVTIHDVVVEAEQRDEHPGPVGPDELDAAEALDGLPWIVMELVPGESLRDILRRGPVDVPEAARIGLAVLGALRAAHAVGIVHRDVKPAHVLLGPHRRVVVTDFGIAHVQGENLLTASGETAAGPPEFVAPERMSGRIAGPASDLWSLGALLYTAVEGTSPFLRSTPEATLAALLAAEPPEPTRAGSLGPLIARLLVPDPDQRPDAEEVAKELEAVAGPAPAEAAARTAEHPRKPDDRTAARPGPVPAAVSTTGLAVPAVQPAPAPASAAPPIHDTQQHPLPPKRQSLLRPGPLALLSALLAGGIGAVTQLAETSSAESAGQAADATDVWSPHPEPDMAAVLHLPRHYRPLDRTGSAADQPRTVLYGDGPTGTIRVRLLFWDRAPASPADQAVKTEETGGETRYTRTSVQGHEASLADTAYRRGETPRRLMRLVIRTDDDRMYELRVDMPKGTPEEEEGTSVFEGARDRLGIVKG
ncbi:serine/threonine protein kinase [Streptomyces qaidamensis]|uniref:non-specific serine/threonine protein kinase n=1 Tax=Streptomyces qaidamensis TaxID=1783515 RepID=A0A143C4Q0_9ACTN|nr:serine/threonine-protein kinase [Streptomyces qaidamensis]AMW12402.1 serine/threonine protein kinase [Streptomyces qaidamensis]